MAVLKQYNENTQQWEAMNFVGDNFFSNRNLLDNPWFTVNQRGVTTWSNSYGVDRWSVSSDVTATLSSNGLTITGATTTSGLSQCLEPKVVENNRTYTFSVMLFDGTVYSNNFVAHNDGTWRTVDLNSNSFVLQYVYFTSSNYWLFIITNKNSTAHTFEIKAIKLELGPISTLANDTAPNYAEELQKCKYYFERYHVDEHDMSYGAYLAYISGNVAYFTVPIQTKRTVNYTITTNSTAISNFHNLSRNAVRVGVNKTGSEGQIVLLGTEMGLNIHFDISADL